MLNTQLCSNIQGAQSKTVSRQPQCWQPCASAARSASTMPPLFSLGFFYGKAAEAAQALSSSLGSEVGGSDMPLGVPICS